MGRPEREVVGARGRGGVRLGRDRDGRGVLPELRPDAFHHPAAPLALGTLGAQHLIQERRRRGLARGVIFFAVAPRNASEMRLLPLFQYLSYMSPVGRVDARRTTRKRASAPPRLRPGGRTRAVRERRPGRRETEGPRDAACPVEDARWQCRPRRERREFELDECPRAVSRSHSLRMLLLTGHPDGGPSAPRRGSARLPTLPLARP